MNVQEQFMTSFRHVRALLILFVGITPTSVGGEKNSYDVVVTGCLKGRELTATDVDDPARTSDVVGRTFHVSGKRAVIDEMKRQNGRLVQVTGSIRKAALATPGIKVGSTR